MTFFKVKNFSLALPFLLIFVLITLIFGSWSCGGKKKKPEELTHKKSTAELISHITSGIISSSDVISIRFVKPMVREEVIGSILEETIFSFSPGIKGEVRWGDNQTLVFHAREKLPFHQNYDGKLFLNKLFPSITEKKPVSFQFQVAGREIDQLDSDFKLRDMNDPNTLIYSGIISFTEPISINQVRGAVSLRMEGRLIPIQWKILKQDMQFAFESIFIYRKKTTLHFKMGIDKKPLGISENIDKAFTLEPLQVFILKEVIMLDQGKKPGLEIKFSDDLDASQDVTGLVRIEPEVKITLKAMGKSIHLGGNFEFGQTYTVSISGIRSRWGTKLSGEVKRQVDFQDKKPQVAFLSDGVFLPSSNQQKVDFKTMNLRMVRLNIKRVFESNLGQFLQTEKLRSRRNRNKDFNQYNINRVGVTVVDRKLEIGNIKNRWLNHQLDLKKMIQPGEKGLFLITLSFKKQDMLYSGLTKEKKYYYGRQYYSNPNSSGYLWRHGRVFKSLVLSDIGLTYKTGPDQHLVLATNILDATPLKNVKVTLRTFQNQIADSKYTDRNGLVLFEGVKDKIFYVEAEKDGQKSMIKPSEMAWNLSSFNVGGEWISPDETRAFIYTDRGVYRPGDKINIALIARNRENSFPENHPVSLKIFNPKNQLIADQTSKRSRDGFYYFGFQSKQEDLTGNWKAKFLVGSKPFYHPLKIETVVPYRLKLNLKAQKPVLGPDDRFLKLDLAATYLFGNPAAFLNTDIEVTLKHREMKFPHFSGFIFNNESLRFNIHKVNVYKGALSQNGQAQIKWPLPPLDSIPSSITARVTAKVMEKGGRMTRNDLLISVVPFAYYVGLQKPEFRFGYSRIGDPVNIPAILTTQKGQVVSGRKLNYRIYRNSRYWWWEYDSRNDFRIRYKKDTYTKLIKQGSLITKNIPVTLTFIPENMGEYFIEVEQEVGKGHVAGFFFSAYYWGDSPVIDDSAGTIVLKSDKKVYHPGDTATIFFSSPDKGAIFLNVEKANKVMFSQVRECTPGKSQDRFEIPVNSEMLPNVYVSVSIIQPHSQTLNDRPLRMYGVIPLMVEDASTRYGIKISMAEKLSSKEKFFVEIQTTDNQPTQYSIAVVDEGLLDLTGFKTPDPWNHFFKKQKLGIKTFDLFSSIIGAHKGDIFRLFSIGGDLETEKDYAASQREPRVKKRFEAVSMFRGPEMTNNRGYAKVSFEMPNYIGAVRVMVVSARGGSYGMAEKTVPVKTEMMVLPTLPRILGPEDKIVVPVTVFVLEDGIKTVDVSIQVRGPVKIIGETHRVLKFEKSGEKDTAFILQAYPAVGEAEITVAATSGRFKSFKKSNLNIRPYSPRIYTTETKECLPGKSVDFIIPGRGIPGTNRVVLSVMRKERLNLNHRLYWLIHYPYGCIEQTVSAAFPQLYLKEFLKQSSVETEHIDSHINAAIKRLRRFQLSSGGLSFWPGNNQISIWGTSYALHFLIEAKKLGYHVPEALISGCIQFQKSRALGTRDNLMEKTYRLYGLALAGEPRIGSMNLIKENSLAEMTDTEKWMLAATYYLAGKKDTAKSVVSKAGIQAKSYSNIGTTYGSYLRDIAMILEISTLFEDWNRADKLYDELVMELSGDSWYSTHSLGYALLALGKYIEANRGDFREAKPLMKGYIKLPGRKKIHFQTDKLKFSHPVTDGFGKKAQIFIDTETNLKRVFVLLEWDGIPLKPDIQDIERNLWLQVEWLDDTGTPIDPTSIRQGSTFWGHFKVGPVEYKRRRLEELALIQILPSGWEIENIRLFKEDLPAWMNKWVLNREEYLDIRDDRIMWFFDLPWNQKSLDFVVKLNAVTVGEFILPPTLFEAMYNNKFKAVKRGKQVRVLEP